MISNFGRRLMADALIKPVHYGSRIYEKWKGKRFGLRHHYYLMKAFRWLRSSWQVSFSYSNPLQPSLRLRWKLDLCQNTQQWLYRSRGSYELPWIRAVARGLAEAQTFLDVGAHVGVFSLTVGQAFPRKQVIAVEGLPANCLLLEENVQRNRLQNVKVLRGVVAGRRGKARFYANPINDGGGSLLPMESYRTGGIALDAGAYQRSHADFASFVEADAWALQDLVATATVLKLDAEGAELEILKAGEEVFRKGLIRMVVIEVLRETQSKLIGWFDAQGFDCFLEDSPVPVRPQEPLGPWKGSMGRILICLPRGQTSSSKFQVPLASARQANKFQ